MGLSPLNLYILLSPLYSLEVKHMTEKTLREMEDKLIHLVMGDVQFKDLQNTFQCLLKGVQEELANISRKITPTRFKKPFEYDREAQIKLFDICDNYSRNATQSSFKPSEANAIDTINELKAFILKYTE